VWVGTGGKYDAENTTVPMKAGTYALHTASKSITTVRAPEAGSHRGDLRHRSGRAA